MDAVEVAAALENYPVLIVEEARVVFAFNGIGYLCNGACRKVEQENIAVVGVYFPGTHPVKFALHSAGIGLLAVAVGNFYRRSPVHSHTVKRIIWGIFGIPPEINGFAV